MAACDDDDEVLEVEVTGEMGGLRLDRFIAAADTGVSRSRARGLIESGRVTIAGATIVEPRREVKSGEKVRIVLPPPEPAQPEGEPIPLDIVYEDAELIVVDKPAGLVVHPGHGNRTGTLVNALIAHCGDSLSGIGGVRRPGIVHRLDKGTSGLLVVAKTDRAHISLASQFADHGRSGPLERGYKAAVWGAPERTRGTVDAPIGRSARNRQLMAIVRRGGRQAITHFEIERRYGPGTPPLASLLACRLETGRTHQIRVHLASIGLPLIGDPDYGAGFRSKALSLPEPARSVVAGFGRQALHAWLLGFEHPVTGAHLRFERAPPGDMRALLDALAEI